MPVNYFAQGSALFILKDVPLDITYNHTWYFSTPAEQLSHFEKQTRVMNLGGSQYQRYDNTSINVSVPMSKLYGANYMYFVNDVVVDSGVDIGVDFQGRRLKYFYAFITDVEYVNPNTSRIYYEIDYMQTFMFDYVLGDSFIVREHSETDNIGDNLANEPFPNLEYEKAMTDPAHPQINKFKIVVQTTEPVTIGGGTTSLTPPQRFPNKNCGVVDGTYYWSPVETEQVSLGDMLNLISKLGDKVIQVYLVPDFAYPSDSYLDILTNSEKTFPLPHIEVPCPSQYLTWGGNWEPKNNKMYTSPYMYIEVTDYAGHNAKYYYEYFDNSKDIKFLFECAFNNGGAMRISPLNYKNSKFNYDKALTINNLPSMSITKDSFAIYMQNNGVSSGISLLSSLIPTNQERYNAYNSANQFSFEPAVSPIPKRQISSTLNFIGNALQASARPDTAITSAYNIKMGVQDPSQVGQDTTTFGIQGIRVPLWQAKIIDEFFTMYGYATNRVKTPNRNVRSRFTYTQTNGCVFKKISLPQKFANKIASIYDNGITFWKPNEEIGNYNEPNKCIKKGG